MTRCVCVCVCVCVYWLDSELAGPQQDVQGAGSGGERDSSAQAQVLLLGPERGLEGPCAAKPALCTGKPITHTFFTLVQQENTGRRDGLLYSFCTRCAGTRCVHCAHFFAVIGRPAKWGPGRQACGSTGMFFSFCVCCEKRHKVQLDSTTMLQCASYFWPCLDGMKCVQLRYQVWLNSPCILPLPASSPGVLVPPPWHQSGGGREEAGGERSQGDRHLTKNETLALQSHILKRRQSNVTCGTSASSVHCFVIAHCCILCSLSDQLNSVTANLCTYF